MWNLGSPAVLFFFLFLYHAFGQIVICPLHGTKNSMSLVLHRLGLLFLNWQHFIQSNLWNGTLEESMHLPWVSWEVGVTQESPHFLKSAPRVCPEAVWLSTIWMGKCFSTPGCTSQAMREIQEGFFISSFNQKYWYLQHKGTLGIDNEESIFLLQWWSSWTVVISLSFSIHKGCAGQTWRSALDLSGSGK